MSQAEWKAFKESGMSLAELEELIICGISYNEYQTRPWLSLGVSRKSWVEGRCNGMGDDDVKAFNDKSPNDYSVIWAFFVPGSMHLKKKEYLTGSLLLGASIASWSAFFLFPEEFVYKGTAEQSGTMIEKQKRAEFLLSGIACGLVSAVLTYRRQDSKPSPSSVSINVSPNGKTFNMALNKRF